MAKNLNLTEKLKKSPRNVDVKNKETEVTPAPSAKSTKKKVGRPKVRTEECKTINIAIPISILEEMNIAKLLYKDNLTLYVNTIIKNDLKENGDKYKAFAEFQQKSLL